jgi:alpha-1,6-mannosyltransferase
VSADLRIAQVANFVGPTSGGMRTAVEALRERYTRAGARCLLVSPGARDTMERTAAGVHVRLRSPQVSGGYRLIVEPWRVTRLLEQFAPTSVEISDKSTLLPVARWANRAGVGCVLFSHERLDAMLALRLGSRTGVNTGIRTGVDAFNRAVTGRFDAIIVTSHYAAGEFTKQASTRTHRIPLGVDLHVFRPRTAAHRSDGVLRLVHAGRLSREKSPDLAVATARELYRRGVRVRLDVYGVGPMLAKLRRLAEGAPVVFHGHIDGRPALAARLAAADVALSVCPGETFGLSILEALAVGTPVVTADSGGGRELLDASSGDWGRPDPESLADAVVRIAERDVASTRAAARRRAEQYDWSSTARSMLSVHEEVGSGFPGLASAG